MKGLRLIAALVATAALAGCATDKPLNFACTRMKDFREDLPTTPGGEARIAGGASMVDSIRAALSTSGVADAGAGPDFLVLSGGGQWGAYGAGFYKGWGKQTDPALKRPTFKVVTGVSTGAMQATFAFLGEDAKLVKAYAISKESELVNRHGSLFFLNHGSYADLSPLRVRARELAGPLLDRVAVEADNGRLLYVGAVDALDGRMYAINLTRIAKEMKGPERLECYTGAILASAAIPVVFRQVTIDGKPYYDGGVRNSVFVPAVQQATAEATAGAPTPGNLYVFINGVPEVKPKTSIKASIIPTLGRLKSITFDQIEQSSVYAAHVMASQTQPMNTYVASARNHGCDEEGQKEDIFDPTFMACLSKAGERAWANGSPWTSYPAGGRPASASVAR